jgi:5-methylcytosine-specific restriction endonuclease McrA
MLENVMRVTKSNKRLVRKPRGQGMNWIRPVKRLAIYGRDGFACVWCGVTIEDGTRLTLDHCVPYSNGGSNHETNLVTSCLRCNSSRGTRSLAAFARAVATYLNQGLRSAEILNHARRCRARKLDMDGAKALIERRGSLAAVLRRNTK